MKTVFVSINDEETLDSMATSLGLTMRPSSCLVDMSIDKQESFVKITAFFNENEPFYQREYIVPLATLSESLVAKIIDKVGLSIEASSSHRRNA